MYCGSRKPFNILRSSEEVPREEYNLFTTRTFVVVTGRVRADAGLLGGERTMDFGFGRGVVFALPFGVEARGFARLATFIDLRAAGFAFVVFALFFVFDFTFAIKYLDSCYAILSAMYC